MEKIQSPSRLKRWLGRLLWVIIGVGLGMAVPKGFSWAMKRFVLPEPAINHIEYADDADWLFNEELTLDTIFPNGVADVLRNPERIELHRAGGDEGVKIGDRSYDSEARQLSPENLETVSKALISLNAYRGTSMCFHPAILLRITSKGQTHDLEFCFGCRNIYCDGNAAIGISTEGCEVFLRCSSETFPEFKELADLRKARK